MLFSSLHSTFEIRWSSVSLRHFLKHIMCTILQRSMKTRNEIQMKYWCFAISIFCSTLYGRKATGAAKSISFCIPLVPPLPTLTSVGSSIRAKMKTPERNSTTKVFSDLMQRRQTLCGLKPNSFLKENWFMRARRRRGGSRRPEVTWALTGWRALHLNEGTIKYYDRKSHYFLRPFQWKREREAFSEVPLHSHGPQTAFSDVVLALLSRASLLSLWIPVATTEARNRRPIWSPIGSLTTTTPLGACPSTPAASPSWPVECRRMRSDLPETLVSEFLW